MSARSASLVLLSGLGADDRLFCRQRERFPALLVPPWIEPLEKESLRQYARRLAEGISIARPCFLGGASFGGMVALEMARHLRPEAVFLIGSCRSPRSIRVSLRIAGGGARRLAAAAFEGARALSPALVRLLGASTEEARTLASEMLRETDPGFLRWGIGAILDWPGVEDPGVPVHHIHGSADQLLPLRRVWPDRVLAGC